MHFYDEQSESTCLFASFYSHSLSLIRDLSLSLSLSLASVISSQNQWQPKCSLNRLIKNS